MKQLRNASRIVALAAFVLFIGIGLGCNDDENGPTSPSGSSIEGAYQVQDVSSLAGATGRSARSTPGTIGVDARWIRFESDGTYTILRAGPKGLRSLEQGLYLVTDSQVILSPSETVIDYGTTIYNYAFDGDTLTLSRPDETATVTRNAATPQAAEWLRPITVLGSVISPVQNDLDLAWDGTSVWIADNNPDPLYLLDPATMEVTDSLSTTTNAYAVEWQDTELWTSSNGSASIYHVDSVTGSTISTSTEMGAWIYGIAWDGTNFWCVSNNERTLYQYDPVGDAVLSTVSLDEDWQSGGGMAFRDGFLYICNAGVVDQCTVSPFAVVNAYRMEGFNITGITSDGTNFFLMAYSDTDYSLRIYKVTLPGVS